MMQFPMTSPAPLPPMMVEALKMRGLDVTRVARPTLNLACGRCRRCQDKDRCFAWLTGRLDPEESLWFCPNAVAFDDLQRQAA